MGTLAAACSSEATRLSENPFGSPFGGKTADATPPVPAAPTGKVQSRALPPPGQQSRAGSLAEPDTGIVTGSIQSHPASPHPVKTADVGNWSSTGGTSLTLGAGETIATLSSRYGVPETALRAANNLAPGANPPPGVQVIIPVYRYGPAIGHPSPAKTASRQLEARDAQGRGSAPRDGLGAEEVEQRDDEDLPLHLRPEPAKPKTAAAAPAQPQPTKAKSQEQAKAEPAEEV